jgi:hypothetical protein
MATAGLIIGLFMVHVGAAPRVLAANYDFQSIQRHGTGASIPNRQAAPGDTEAIARQMGAQGMQEFIDAVNSGGPVYGAAEAAAKGETYKILNRKFSSRGLVQHLRSLSVNKRVRLIKKLGVNQKAAHKIAKSLGKNLDNFSGKLGYLDKAATLSEAAGAASAGDAVGTGQALANGSLSGTAAAAGGALGSVGGSWLGLKLGASVGIIGGPLGSAIGGGVGAVGGAILGSFLYDWYGKPEVDKAADSISKDIQAAHENAEREIRRVRTDLALVYPQHAFVAADKAPDADKLHQMAEDIRNQRHPGRFGDADECPLDPNKFKAGICGCGTPDTDSDGDQVPDCIDQCPHNAKRHESGPTGCDTVVPNVNGLTAQAAKGTISSAGLAPLLSVGDPAPDRASQYTVYTQTPSAGNRVDPGDSVSAVLYSKYKEKKVTVPDVVGLGATEAKIRIAGKGLVAAAAQGDRAPQATQSNTVQGQSPAAGQRVKEQSTVTLTLYGPYEKNERCSKNQELFYAAFQADNMDQCRQVLSQSQDCAFYSIETSKLDQHVCRNADAAYYSAIKARDYGRARSILARNTDCDFYNDRMQSLHCSENLAAMTAAYNAKDMNRFRSVLARSTDCGFYNEFVAALQKAENQKKRNRQLANAAGHILGGLIADAIKSPNTRGSTGGASGSSGPPVVHHGVCNDVRKAGSNAPERHVIDLGSGGKSFLFEFETYSEEDMITVSQGSSVLFSSGCVGTKGRRAVQLKKGLFDSEITVDVRPNCKDGTHTQWEFVVHCPQ